MIRKSLQYLADKTIVRLGAASDDDMFQFYFEFGIWLDNFAINYFGIYLE